jgi:serine/threonine-protein kinase
VLEPGAEIAGYRIERPLGRGGMGAVYEATQLSLGRTVALKLLGPGLGDSDAFKERFRREARLQARLEHPSIVPVYEAGEAPEGLYISMRLVRGTNLHGLVRSGELAPARAMKLLKQVAEALDAAHEAGLLHRDVKPANILVDERDRAFLADFGITKAADETAFTRTGGFLGTLAYAAPEQIQGEAAPASDVYALAGVAYECLTGSIPFPGLAEPAMIYAQLADTPMPATERNQTLPAAVDAVLGRGLAKAAADRQPTASALIDDLAAVLDDAAPPTAAPEAVRESVTTRPATPPPPEPRAPRRRVTRPIVAGAVVAAVLLGLLGGSVMGKKKAPALPVLRSGLFAIDAPKGVTLTSAKTLGEGTPVRVGDGEALREQLGSHVEFRFLAEEGVVVVVNCDGVPAKDCEAAAASLRGGTLARVTPDPNYAKALGAALADLTAKVDAAQASFRARRTAGRAGAVARDYAKVVLPAPPPRAKDAATHLADALKDCAAAWERMAASTDDRARYRSAETAIHKAEAGAATALAAFKTLGYADPAQ